MVAGYYRLRDFSIDGAGTLSQVTDSPELQLPVKTFSMDASGNYFNAQGQQVSANEVLRPEGFIAKITGFSPNFYYTDATRTSGAAHPDLQRLCAARPGGRRWQHRWMPARSPGLAA